MALSFLDGIFRVSSRNEPIPKEDPYDVVVNVDSLIELGRKGWEVESKSMEELLKRAKKQAKKRIGSLTQSEPQEEEMADVSKTKTMMYVVIAVLGLYNHGKSWFLNQLANVNFQTGTLVHTKGLSVKLGDQRNKLSKNFVLLDTEGSDAPVPCDQLLDRAATETFLRKAALSLCSVVIVVVNRLRCSDQKYIRSMAKAACLEKKTLYIVHNLHEISETSVLQQVIDHQVEHCCKAEPRVYNPDATRELKFWESYMTIERQEIEVKHYVMARQDSEAGKAWNGQTLELIRTHLQASGTLKKGFDLLKDLQTYTQRNLSKYVQEECSVSIERGRIIACNNSKPLTLRKLRFDEGGNVVEFARHGQIQPPFNVVETSMKFVVQVDLAGCSDVVQQIHRRALLLTGVRDAPEYKEEEARYLEESIAYGRFSLEITFDVDVIKEDAIAFDYNGLRTLVIKKDTDEAQNVEVKEEKRKFTGI